MKLLPPKCLHIIWGFLGEVSWAHFPRRPNTACSLLIQYRLTSAVPPALGEASWEKLPRRAEMTGSPQLYLKKSPERNYLGEPG